MRNIFEGHSVPHNSLKGDNDLHLTVTGIREHEDPWPLRDWIAPNLMITLDVKVEWPNGNPRNYEMMLGSIALEESVAFLVGERFREELSLRGMERIPEFPYRVAERVFEYIVGNVPSSIYFPAALGTLALLSAYPGPCFVKLLRIFKGALDRNDDENQSLREVTLRHCEEIMMTTIPKILNEDLPDLENIHENRGMLEGAIDHLSQTFQRALNLRMENPLFDLEVAFPGVPPEGWQQLVRDYPPCDLLQEYHGDVQILLRDQLFRFGEADTANNYLRAFQAQENYLESHLGFSNNGGFISSDNTQTRCPFFTACELPLRRNHQRICQERPWQSYQQEDNAACWYHSAVAASLGTVSLG